MRPWTDRDVLAHVFGRAVLEQAAAVLAPAGILLMPLKGIWLQHVAYADPAARQITDVDAVVPEAEFETAVRLLRSAGWEVRGTNVTETGLIAPGMPLPLDLHRRLFTRFAFDLPTDALFARAHLDAVTFDIPVMMPDPRDAFAHLLGHFVKNRGETGTDRFARDIVLTARAFALQPAALAAHLRVVGLERAARYALAIAAEMDEARPLCHEIVACLPADPVGEALAHALVRVREHLGPGSRWGALPGFALDRSLLRGGRSVLVRWFDRRHDRRSGV